MDKRLVIVSDFQAPYHLPQAVALVTAFVKDYKPDTLIFNGDIVDFVSVSKFAKGGRLVPSRVVDEAHICRAEVVDPIMAALPKGAKVYWIEGNHEFRLKRYIYTMAPALEDAVSFESLLGLADYGIQYVPGRGTSGNGVLRLTPLLTVCHGERHGTNPAKLTLDDWGGSIVVGHAHKEATWRKTYPSGIDWVAMAAGCLCKDGEWKAFSGYNRGFIAGEYSSTTGEFNLDHMRISGDNWTRLYTPYGRYHAVASHGDSYIGKRVK